MVISAKISASRRSTSRITDFLSDGISINVFLIISFRTYSLLLPKWLLCKGGTLMAIGLRMLVKVTQIYLFCDKSVAFLLSGKQTKERTLNLTSS